MPKTPFYLVHTGVAAQWKFQCRGNGVISPNGTGLKSPVWTWGGLEELRRREPDFFRSRGIRIRLSREKKSWIRAIMVELSTSEKVALFEVFK